MEHSTQALASPEQIAQEIRQTRLAIDELEIKKIRGAIDLWKANALLVELEAYMTDLSDQLWALGGYE